ncbi:MAG: hypothetical protein KBF21_15735 [Thermoanaerobaculia bacterium]|nr:hypothetical protein [Thermoanaerobaculia bacterium]
MYRRQTTVTYLLNGSPISPSFGPPYTWATTASAPGAFSITAQAVDSRGGQTVSTPITLTIAVPTSVVITSPANGGTYAVGQALTIAASASDPDGVARVEFTYNGGNPLGTVATPPYQIVLPGGAPAGTYTIVARMVDVPGNAVNSAPVTFYVTGFEARAEPGPGLAEPGHDPRGGPPPAPASGAPARAVPAAAAWLALRQVQRDGVRVGRRRQRRRRSGGALQAWVRRALLAVVVVLGVSAPTDAQVTLEYYHLDPTGSVRMTTDQTGAVTARYDYTVFGEEPTLGGQPRKFAGKERDAETGYDYFGGRYYAASIGRFTTVDPAYALDETLVDPQRWNRYAYVRNNPLKYTDPDGRILETLWDIANVGMGVWSLGGNVVAGNWAAAALDVGGIVLDGLSAATPFVPGGAGMSAIT